MVKEIIVPTLGESVSEATIGQWFKKVGDVVKADEPLLELETDKVAIEVPSPVSGKISKHIVKEGDTVSIGALLGYIEEGATETIISPAESVKVVAAESTNSKPLVMEPSPAAAKIIAENSLDEANIEGTGKRGQILKGDAIGAIKNDIQVSELTERVRMTKLRQTIAKRLKDAQNTAAMLTTFNEVDMTAIMNMRKNYKDLFEKKHNVKLGFMGFFTKAVCHALNEIPAINAQIDGDSIIYHKYVNAGIAVGTDKGLVVPVVRNADKLSIAEIEKEIGRLGKLARDGKLSVSDMNKGTFTITNGGVYGSLMSTPILNTPQSGILGLHAVKERPIALNGEVVIRPMMYLALSYDHRIVDGKEAVTFLVRIKECLENPERLVLDL